MKYLEVRFIISPCSGDSRDILSALAGDAGFETFEETETGLTGYVQKELFSEEALRAAIDCFPLPDIHIEYDVREAEDRDWNAAWEEEGFEPIVVRGSRKEERGKRKEERGERKVSPTTLVIHDGRHLPSDIRPQTSDLNHQPSAIMIEIDAHMAFGTGTHETTRMICSTLLQLAEKDGTTWPPEHVLDCGSGTGILSICALKLGATSCMAYDIDEWSVDNTRHNAVINQVDNRLTVLHGDATLLDSADVTFGLVMANINRNILLQDMERFVRVMDHKALLILSGFYKDDCILLINKAQSLGLTLLDSKTEATAEHGQDCPKENEWACLLFSR